MTLVKVPNRSEVDSKSQAIFDQLKGKLGMVPNLYATIGYSSNALENFLTFSGKVGQGSFTNKEKEAINLAVSQVNECEYCLSAHTAISKMNGLTEEDTLSLRAGHHNDQRLGTLASLAQNIAINRGKPTEEALQAFYDQGFNHGDLVELISVVAAITFTNFIHGATNVPVDFPAIQQLQPELA